MHSPVWAIFVAMSLNKRLMWSFDCRWSTIRPRSILRDLSPSRAKQKINGWVMSPLISLETSVVIEPAVPADRCGQTCESFFLSLFVCHFHLLPTPAGSWQADTNQFTDNFPVQYLSSSALPSLPFRVIRVPIALCGTTSRTRQAVWGLLTTVILF